jgi:hypothetical protein
MSISAAAPIDRQRRAFRGHAFSAYCNSIGKF